MTVARGHVSSSEIFTKLNSVPRWLTVVCHKWDAHSSQSIQKLNLEREVREDERILKWVQTTYYVMRLGCE